MRRFAKHKRGWVLGLLLTLGEPASLAPIAAAGAATVALSLPGEAQAQAWGMSRRTARRTSRRTTRRNVYYGGGGGYYGAPYVGVLPTGYDTVVVDGDRYYEADGVRYVAKVIDGETVYVVVED